MSTLLSLRPYQVETIQKIDAAEQRGVRRQLVVKPTGTGKTVTFAHLIQQRGGRALVLAHRDELISQAIAKIRQVQPSADLGRVQAEDDETHAAVVVASIQTLAQERRRERLGRDFDTVIVDEAHHAAAPTYRQVLAHVGAFDQDGPLVVGFTATPDRGDGLGLHGVFQEIVFECSLADMIGQGYLVDLRALQIRLDADFGQVHTRGGDFVESELADVLLEANAPEHTVHAYQEHAARRKALVFTPGVELAHAMARSFCAAGIPAEAVDGGMPREERRAVLERFHTGATQVLANCAVLTEGYDEPSTDCIIIARPTRNRALYTQMIGRGTRLYPGKDDCLILDEVGVAGRLNLVTTASLFGLEPAELSTRTLRQVLEARQQRQFQAKGGRLTSQVVDLFQQRPLHWLKAGSRYTLNLGDGFLALTELSDGWAVTQHGRDGLQRFLASGLSLGYAQGTAEDYARHTGATVLVDPQARWRQQPATRKQIAALIRMRVPISPGITAGEASDLISTKVAGGRR